MSPELETLDQLLGGDMPLPVIRSLFESDAKFVAGISALLRAGEVKLLSADETIPKWRWSEVLAVPESQFRLAITVLGVQRIA